MHVPAHAARALRVALIACVLASGPAVRSVVGATAPASDEPSDIVLVLDFSGSILEDGAIRSEFAVALDGIAARIEQTAATLAAGDATVSIVTFATRAADLPECTRLQLRESEAAVAALAGCLRRVAATYRRGVDPALTNAIGDDTNYVAAMERAAAHLPPDSVRPAIIFFTDGRHEAAGVPVTDVIPARDRLFGSRSPFALLPVGMGVNPADRPRLEAGLADLRVTREFERCEGGALAWPDVVFESAEAAGRAVGLALQDVSCTFTVAPTAAPTPSPEPSAVVHNVRLRAGDSAIEVSWSPPSDAPATTIDDYRVRCRPSAGGEWIESTEGVSTELSATVGGLVNGVEYVCEVSAVGPAGAEAWTAGVASAVPFGRPPPPGKPSVQALDSAVRLGVTMPTGAPVTGFVFECSADGGSTWTVERRVDGDQTVVDVAGLSNGIEYVCRAFASNDNGVGDASPLSDAVRPCSGLIDCNPLVLPLLAAFVVLLVAGTLLALWRWYTGRRVYVTAQVDHFAPTPLGRGPRVGMAFIRREPHRRVVGVAPAEGRGADVRIRYAGGDRFVVSAAGSRRTVAIGHLVEVADPAGQRHDLVLYAYDEPPQPLRRPDDEVDAPPGTGGTGTRPR